jgi:hypothetical protein
MKIKLGQKLKCRVTGIEGIATAKCEYLNGCIQIGITPLADTNKYPETHYIDYKQLEVIGDGISIETENTGGTMINTPH